MPEQAYNNYKSLLIRLIRFFARQNVIIVVVFGYLIVILIGMIDYFTGVEIAFSIFYVVPVAIVVLATNRTQGLIISLVAGGVWLVADLLAHHVYTHPAIPWWNAAVRFFFFAIITNFASALKKMYEHQENLARTDFLTGTANRRLLFETAQMRFLGPDANNRPLTAVYLDLDNFKKINDELGHATGDKMLQSVGEIIKENLRKTDIVARVGGDEFVILLPAAGAEDSKQVVTKIRNKITELARKENLPLTITMGVATFLTPPKSVDDMISKADDLMYQAKEAGKNATKYRIWKS